MTRLERLWRLAVCVLSLPFLMAASAQVWARSHVEMAHSDWLMAHVGAGESSRAPMASPFDCGPCVACALPTAPALEGFGGEPRLLVDSHGPQSPACNPAAFPQVAPAANPRQPIPARVAFCRWLD